jgi:hypothetical protein
MKSCLRTIACLAVSAWASQGATTLIFTGVLAPEVAGSSGSGTALVTYDDIAHTLQVQTVWQDLTGPTSVAHIHCCVDPPGTVSVAFTPGTLPGFPAGLTAGAYDSGPVDLTLTTSYTNGFLSGAGGGTVAGAEAALIQGLLAGRAYLNIHSSFAPGGEIRDFLQVVPEPGTYALFAAGFAALAGYRLRKRSS